MPRQELFWFFSEAWRKVLAASNVFYSAHLTKHWEYDTGAALWTLRFFPCPCHAVILISHLHRWLDEQEGNARLAWQHTPTLSSGPIDPIGQLITAIEEQMDQQGPRRQQDQGANVIQCNSCILKIIIDICIDATQIVYKLLFCPRWSVCK